MHPSVWLRISWLGIFLLLPQTMYQSFPQRYGLTPGDRFRLCAGRVLGKPILTDDILSYVVLDCPVSKEALLKELENKKIYNFPLDDFNYWVPADKFTPFPRSGPTALWDQITGDVKFKNWGTIPGLRLLSNAEMQSGGTIPGLRLLSNAEMQSIGTTILNETRLAPYATPYLPGKDGKTAEIEYTIFFDAHHLTRKGPESVLAISGQENGGEARVVYGEIQGGTYHLLWESALFDSVGLQIGYSDVDGDGTDEILIETGDGDHRLLTVFDRTGRELTRQADDCNHAYLLQPEEATCPIFGNWIELVDSGDGRKDILAHGDEELGISDLTYHLTAQGYVLKKTPNGR